MDISGNRSRININVDNLRMGSKFVEFSGDTVVKASTNGKQQIAVIDSHIGSISAVHAQISNKQRMVGGNSASAHNGRYHRNLGFLSHFGENFSGSCNVDTAPCQKQRFFGFLEKLQLPFSAAPHGYRNWVCIPEC